MMDDMKNYVLYNEDGSLDGAYLQLPPKEHLQNMIVVDEFVRLNWTSYHANDTRDGVVKMDVPIEPPPSIDQ